MVTLNIDTETFKKLQQRAIARGLSVEAWLRQQVDRDTSAHLVDTKASQMSAEEWDEWLNKMANRHPPTGYPMDDSRESIYD